MNTKKYENPVMVNIQLEGAKLEALKQVARQISVSDKKDISYADLIRQSVDNYLYDVSLTQKFNHQLEK